ncbi:outer membrane beta-barrel protein [Methylovulum miyakonense]|uniref:outer membrane beta-barrel protein n=1 Tax=Methylovulum miyakonense TaxID=645578 RepID=UPI00036B54EE|nr:outer membrane beta-barrel protein [Methylovulum miyakonense]
MKRNTIIAKGALTGTTMLLLLSGLLSAPLANAEISLGLYAGQSFTDNGDLNLTQGKTNLNFSDVSWDDKSFEEPIFYGARIGYWFEDAPNWGLSIDFAHLKNYLEYDKNAQVSGTDANGNSVNGVEPISNHIQDFNMSHGVNTLTFNGQYRWFPAGQRDQTLLGRMQLYTGLGAGFSVPHVEAMINGVQTYEYQAGAGPVVNGMMGINYDIYSFISGFAEYKLTYVDVEDDLTGGGTISTETVNHQLIFGLAAHF